MDLRLTRLVALTGLLACLTLAACGTSPPRQPTAASPAGPGGREAAVRAIAQVGAPYRYGGDDPASGFDCSGLVRWAWQDLTREDLPRASADLHRLAAPSVRADRLAPGDLVFFRIARKVSHVGIYVGDGRFVHAPSSGGRVRLDRLDDDYWRARYAGARRLATASP